MSENTPFIEVKNLKKYFSMTRGFLEKSHHLLKAVDDISFSIPRGETLGLVGESGCGKTTVGRTIDRIYEPTGGEVLYDGTNIFSLSDSQMLSFRKKMQMIFQDPYSSLNPRMTVSEIISEPMEVHKIATGKEGQERVFQLLEMVGLSKEHACRFPHEFSGGQRQRIGIARALAVEPQFIICDEPISALDVSIQAQIINLLEELQEKLKLTYLFIAHDISMVKHTSSRIAVMYLGKLVEMADSYEIYKNPLHPYTQALLSAVPVADPDIEASRKRIILEGDVPSPIDPPEGCRFKTRCKYAIKQCNESNPSFKDVGNNHFVSCFAIK